MFQQTIQKYWVMKNIVALAMTTYKEREDLEEDRPKEPILRDLQREIQFVQMQLYQNNIYLNRVEQSLHNMMRSEFVGSSVKAPAAVDSSDE